MVFIDLSLCMTALLFFGLSALRFTVKQILLFLGEFHFRVTWLSILSSENEIRFYGKMDGR